MAWETLRIERKNNVKITIYRKAILISLGPREVEKGKIKLHENS